jgi:hypothetical protein
MIHLGSATLSTLLGEAETQVSPAEPHGDENAKHTQPQKRRRPAPVSPPLLTQEFFSVDGKVHRRAKGVILTNASALFFGTGYTQITPPDHRSRGFRNYPTAPLYKISTSLGRRLEDIEIEGAYWLISDRAKNILASFNQQDFSFLEIDTITDPGSGAKRYWLCDVMPILDVIDEARSRVPFYLNKDGRRTHYRHARNSYVFKPDVVGSHSAFRLETNVSDIFISSDLRRKLKESRITGLRFRPAIRKEQPEDKDLEKAS